MIATEDMTRYVEAFTARIGASEACACETFPEVSTDPTTVRVVETVIRDLSALVEAGADVEELTRAASHAFVTVAAWGYGLGSLSTLDLIPADDDDGQDTRDPAVRDWEETLRQAPGAGWE